MCPSKMSHAQNRESRKWMFVTWMTVIGFFSRNLAAMRAMGRPHSDRLSTLMVPYFWFLSVMLLFIPKHLAGTQAGVRLSRTSHDSFSNIYSISNDSHADAVVQRYHKALSWYFQIVFLLYPLNPSPLHLIWCFGNTRKQSPSARSNYTEVNPGALSRLRGSHQIPIP